MRSVVFIGDYYSPSEYDDDEVASVLGASATTSQITRTGLRITRSVHRAKIRLGAQE